MRNLETSWHLMWSCPFSRLIWHEVAAWTGCEALKLPATSSESSLKHCQRLISKTPPIYRKGVKAMLMMICWEIWKEMNAYVFRAKQPRVEGVIHAAKRNMEGWRLAGASCLETPFGDRTAR